MGSLGKKGIPLYRRVESIVRSRILIYYFRYCNEGFQKDLKPVLHFSLPPGESRGCAPRKDPFAS